MISLITTTVIVTAFYQQQQYQQKKMTATFYANPNEENEPWIENAAIDGYGFRNWHLMFFVFATILTLMIMICCCFKFRIPRTKQEIEGDYHRKKLAEKFRQQLKTIHNQEMDSIDLQQALKIIQQHFDDNNKENVDNETRIDVNTFNAKNPKSSCQFIRKFGNFMLNTTNVKTPTSV